MRTSRSLDRPKGTPCVSKKKRNTADVPAVLIYARAVGWPRRDEIPAHRRTGNGGLFACLLPCVLARSSSQLMQLDDFVEERSTPTFSFACEVFISCGVKTVCFVCCPVAQEPDFSARSAYRERCFSNKRGSAVLSVCALGSLVGRASALYQVKPPRRGWPHFCHHDDVRFFPLIYKSPNSAKPRASALFSMPARRRPCILWRLPA